MQKTTNYQLNQWEPSDPIRRGDFNADNAKLDAAIKAVADTANSKASPEELAAVSENVNTEFAAVSRSVAALSEAVNARKIAVGSYIGNDDTQTISVGFTPKLVFVHAAYSVSTYSHRTALAITDGDYRYSSSVEKILLAITDGGFYLTYDSGDSMNDADKKYYYVAVC